MRKIFEQGVFDNYKSISLNDAKESVFFYSLAHSNTTVFISHKHSDLSDLMGLIGFLEKTYSIKAFIDSKDPSMPETTSGETAITIKKRINSCKKFILLATNAAIESKWCNWELGFGDAKKFKENIAIFPVKPKGTPDSDYKGHEYLDIYPHIVRYDQLDLFNGKLQEPGYYVKFKEQDEITYSLIPLTKWFNNNK